MNNPTLYANANSMQIENAQDVFKDYFHLLNFSKNGGETIMDVGCGDGKVTMEILHKRLPPNFGQLIGTDVSEKMIKFAKASYSSDNVNFEVLDISGELNNKFKNSFDHVFSFNCLHWVQNQRSALKNIYNLLKTNGECLMYFQTKSQIFEAYKNLSENPCWSFYMKDYKKYVSPYYFTEDPAEECRRLMYDAGFKHVQVENKQKVFYLDGEKRFKEFVFAINPFLDVIPPNLHDQYFEDYKQQLSDMGWIVEGDKDEGTIYKAPHFYAVCYAIK